MKTLCIITALIVWATVAQAAGTVNIFNNLSTTGTSSAFRVNAKTKTVVIQGYSNAKAEQALAGTFALQCSPTSGGPWATCKDQAANAISTTSNALFTAVNGVTWVRGSWTKSGGGNVSAWLLTID